MKRWLVRCAVGAAALLAALYVGSIVFPADAARGLTAALRWSAGLSARSVETDHGRIAYLEGGAGETVLFLHGVYARKEHWIDMSRALSGGYRVILLDLPGFGENAPLPPGGYRFEAQKAALAHVVDRLGLDRFHIVANSMGAQIAGLLATEAPERVLSLAFVGGPAGVRTPESSDMEQALRKGVAPLVVGSEQEFYDRMAWLFPKTPFIPAPITKTWAAEEAARAGLNRRIWREIGESSAPPLLDLAPELRMPTLVVWCDQDRVFHVSGAGRLVAALPGGRRAEIRDCGHVPMLDRPVAVGAAQRDFLDRLAAPAGEPDVR